VSRQALVCEDDPAIRSLLRTLLRREGFDVDVAENGRVGIERIERHCYELIILDLMMPDLDGYAVVERLKELNPPTLQRIVVVTAATDAVRGDFPEPICTLLAKPFDINAITALVRECTHECE
jgi:CheY-like chemotaxis protein